jgi:hypothetical protein
MTPRAAPHRTADLTQTTIDQPRRRRRWGTIASVTLAVVLAATAVAWSAQSDGSPGAPSDSTGRQEAPSLLESPAEFDTAIADAVRNAEDDSIMHNGDAFDRAVEAAK